jgi:hypothetical protein
MGRKEWKRNENNKREKNKEKQGDWMIIELIGIL